MITIFCRNCSFYLKAVRIQEELIENKNQISYDVSDRITKPQRSCRQFDNFHLTPITNLRKVTTDFEVGKV